MEKANPIEDLGNMVKYASEVGIKLPVITTTRNVYLKMLAKSGCTNKSEFLKKYREEYPDDNFELKVIQ